MVHEAPKIISQLIPLNHNLICKGSAGKGKWADTPWLAIFDQTITTTAQDGFYPVYLFKNDMSGVYLSLNQGITVVKSQYKSKTDAALKARAVNFRAKLGSEVASALDSISLSNNAKGNTAFYQDGNIYAIYYDASSMPQNEILCEDLKKVLNLYEYLVVSEFRERTFTLVEGDEKLYEENPQKLINNRRIERNRQLSIAVKKKLGYKCQVCGLSMKDIYGEIGENYIEAHHLIPISELKDINVYMSPFKDFAVLCPNCHRMIHLSEEVADIVAFKNRYFKK